MTVCEVANPYVLFVRVYESHEPQPIDSYGQIGGKLKSLLLACWTRDPAKRPSAAKLITHPFMQG